MFSTLIWLSPGSTASSGGKAAGPSAFEERSKRRSVVALASAAMSVAPAAAPAPRLARLTKWSRCAAISGATSAAPAPNGLFEMSKCCSGGPVRGACSAAASSAGAKGGTAPSEAPLWLRCLREMVRQAEARDDGREDALCSLPRRLAGPLPATESGLAGDGDVSAIASVRAALLSRALPCTPRQR